MSKSEKVVSMPPERVVGAVPPPPSPPGRLHGLTTAGMGISAIVGVTAMLAFITITWPESIRRVVIGICLISGLLFMTFASLAVFTAARDTYRNAEDRIPND